MNGAPPMGNGRWLMFAAAAVVIATVGAAVSVMDPPSRQRAERLDGIRVGDLQLLASRIDAHADVNDALPERLAVVTGKPGPTIADPATGQPYHYEVTGERAYRLCATFETATGDGPSGPRFDDAWRHVAGRQCFDRTVSAKQD